MPQNGVVRIRQIDERDLLITDPDAIRAAIDAADERARLLRRLLRLAMRLGERPPFDQPDPTAR